MQETQFPSVQLLAVRIVIKAVIIARKGCAYPSQAPDSSIQLTDRWMNTYPSGVAAHAEGMETVIDGDRGAEVR